MITNRRCLAILDGTGLFFRGVVGRAYASSYREGGVFKNYGTRFMPKKEVIIKKNS